MTGVRASRAASTPCEIAQSRSRDGIICSSESSGVRGTGMGQPVRWATTDSSAHSLIAGYSSSARWAIRISRRVHGRPTQSAPQVMLRDRTTPAGVAVAPCPAASRPVPSGIRVSSG
jgi:hypothetical protein